MAKPQVNVLLHLRRLLSVKRGGPLPDQELLQRFLATREESAFAALVERHGPMVQNVCMCVLRHRQDAEDVCQATFLVLARKACSIRKRTSLASWLHGVAYRLARKEAGKRRTPPQPTNDRSSSNPMDELSGREVCEMLHDELNRLPEKNRLPLLLCYLEGQTQEEAARHLGWTAGAVKGRLNRGREALRRRLTRRGLALTVPLLAASLAPGALSAALVHATAQSAVLFHAGRAIAGIVSAKVIAVAEGGLTAMFMTKLKLTAVLLLALTLLVGGVGLAVHHAQPDAAPAIPLNPQAKPQPQAKLQSPKKDVENVEAPLPAGALMRLGETRFRPGARIRHLAFSPDGKQLASWGNWLYFEDRLSIWDVATGRELRTHAVDETLIGGLCWGPGERGFVLQAKAYERGGLNTFRLWAFTDPAAKLPQKTDLPLVRNASLGADDQFYSQFALAPDGTTLAAFRSAANATTGTLELFDATACASGKELKRIETRAQLPRTCTGLQFIRGGKALVILTSKATENEIAQGKPSEQSVLIWDYAQRTMSEPFVVPPGVAQRGRQSFDVMEDGSALAIGLEDGTIKVFDLPSGKQRLAAKKHDAKIGGTPWSEVCAIKFVNAGRNLLSAGQDNRQIVWDAKTGADVAVLNGHRSWVEAVAESPDGKSVATAGQDSLIRLWDSTTWKPILAPQGPRGVVRRLEVSRDRKYAAAGCDDGVHVWELASGREVLSRASDYRSGHVLFSPQGAVITGDADRNLTFQVLPAGDPQSLKAKGLLLDFTPDGKTLLTAQGKNVVLWDWPACAQRAVVKLHSEPTSAAMAPDGSKAVIGFQKGTAVVFDLPEGKLTSELPLQLHWFARAAGVAPGGRVVCGTVGRSEIEACSITANGWMKRFETPPITNRPRGAPFYTLSFAISIDGRRSASCQNDGGVTVYETATGKILSHFAGHRDGVIGLAFTPDGNRLLSAGGDHQVLVWDISLAKLAGEVKPLTAAEQVKAWDQLGTLAAKDAMKTMAAMAADTDAALALLATKMKPIAAADPVVLDRILRDFNSDKFDVRTKAERELNELGEGAVAGVRKRAAKAETLEVKQRAERFLRQYETDDIPPDRLRVLRVLDMLVAINTTDARKLVESFAAGAADTWLTDAAKRTLSSWTPSMVTQKQK